MDAIAAVLVCVLFFFIGVGVQVKNPGFGQAIYSGWKSFWHKVKRK
ncbi:MAG: hypothetical protein MESAZ_01050 [Saezia sanguinis]